MARLNLVAANKEARAPRVRATARPVAVIVSPSNDDQKDHFITKNGVSYAGSHLIIDLWEAEGLADRERIEAALIDAVTEAGATLLHIHLHTFEEGGWHLGRGGAGGKPHLGPHLAGKGLCRVRRLHVRRRPAPQGAGSLQARLHAPAASWSASISGASSRTRLPPGERALFMSCECPREASWDRSGARRLPWFALVFAWALPSREPAN